MRRVFAAFGFLALAGTLIASFLVVPAGKLRAYADRNATFLIPASDGYGIAQCISSAAPCGEVVANAWCEANGYARAQSFGIVARDDHTGSISAVSLSRTQRDEPLSITCSN